MYSPLMDLIKFHLQEQGRSVRRKEWFLQVKVSLDLLSIKDMLFVHVGGYLINQHFILPKLQQMAVVFGALTTAETTLIKVTMSIATVKLQ